MRVRIQIAPLGGALAMAALLATGSLPRTSSAAPPAAGVPRLEHVVVIVMENKSYDEVRHEPFMAGLIASGATFANYHATTHPSLPNYLALWCGQTLGVQDDACPPTGAPFDAENLGHACEKAGLTWKAYSEDLPAPGDTACFAHDRLYARKHAPWTYCKNLDHRNELPFEALAIAEAAGKLPNLAFVVPNQCDDTHNAHKPGCDIPRGDAWLAAHVPAMLRAVGPRGVVIVTWDEDDKSAGNRILTTFDGVPVKKGFVSERPADHYSLLRTICDALGLPPMGVAAGAQPVDDIWTRGGRQTGAR